MVRLAPIDVLLALGIAHEELVLRRAARMRARIDDHLTVTAKNSLTTSNDMLDELGGGQIVVLGFPLEAFRYGENG